MLKKLLAVSRYPHYCQRLWWRLAVPPRVRWMGVRADSSVIFHGMPVISLAPGSRIDIGRESVLCSHSSMTALGVEHPVVLRTLREGARILIGEKTGISGGAICAASAIEIGNGCLLGADVVIADTDFHALAPAHRGGGDEEARIGVAPVVIEDNVFVGTRAIILKGVRVGRNSVIGAGSVVTRDVPPDSIVAGNPAKILRSESPAS